MLVLSRHTNEVIKISDDITITIVEIRGDKCRIGISAPPSVPVHRGEVYDKIVRDNGTNKSLAGAPAAPLSHIAASAAARVG